MAQRGARRSNRPRDDDQVDIDRLPVVIETRSVRDKLARELSTNWTRHHLAAWLIATIVFVIAGGGLAVIIGALTTDEAEDLLTLVLTPLFALLGTVIAFYFRSSSHR
ncbi:MAG: hypothetical protein ACRD29_25790 [Acidimicrobiales bacterium]